MMIKSMTDADIESANPAEFWSLAIVAVTILVIVVKYVWIS